MRLVQFSVSAVWRGHEQKIIYLHQAFEELGLVDEQWILCAEGTELHKRALEIGANVLTIDFKGQYNWGNIRKVTQHISSTQADVVFLHNTKAQGLAVMAATFIGLRTPLVLCRTLIKRVDTNIVRKWKYNHPSIKKIICVSQPVVESLKPAIKNHSKLTVVGSVTDPDRFLKKEANGCLRDELGLSKTTKIIGNIAAFTGFKDYPTWLRAAKRIFENADEDTAFVSVGKGKLMDEMKSLASELGLDGKVHFLGFRRDIPELLPEFDIFMFTSNAEPTGGVLLEAYACRVPIVAADAGGIPEVVIDGKTGILAEVGNPEDFASKVLTLLNDETTQKNLTDNGYLHLQHNFTKEVIAKKMMAEIRQALDN